MEQDLYVGGNLQNIKSAKYGVKGGPKNREDLIGGFKAPIPRTIVSGGKKRQTKFKSNVKGQEYVQVLNKELEKASKALGVSDMTPKMISDKIKKERLRFRSIVNKGSTQIKKKELKSGATKKKANESKKKFSDAMKETLKRLIQKHILLALKEFNDRLK